MLGLKYQNERLRHEVSQERDEARSKHLSYSEVKMHKFEMLMQEQNNLQKRYDETRDENVTLKLKVADLEGELLDERTHNKVKTDSTVEALKSQVQSQYFDSKLRFDEDLMKQKEAVYHLKI